MTMKYIVFLHDYTAFLNVGILKKVFDKRVTIIAQKNIAKYSYLLMLSENFFSHQ